ncbi:MAG TPA: MFS transporter [Dyella sp.]|uniref:MFS transporter n=1 Tax=Dyella sp. TaxID=1869338 RepID=UPI002C9EA876|nr:MFS transporter [Dyella sp.]HUB92294.1 MFS transporter [Dyella sp.]
MALVALLALGHCMAFIDRNLPAVAAPLLKTDLGLTDTQMGLLDGPAFAALYVAGMLASWPLAHSSHRLRSLAGCIAIWMLGMAIFAFGHSFATLVVARALVGLGQAAFVPLALGLIVTYAPAPWRARSMAIFTAGASAGRSLSLLLGGAALALFAKWLPASAFTHWRLLFLVMAAPNLVLIVLLLCRAEPCSALPATRTPVFSQMFASFRERPVMMSAYLCGAAASVLVVQTVGAWAPSVLHRQQGLTPAAAALVFGAALLVASPFGHFIAGTLVDKRGEKLSPTSIVAGALLLVIPVIAVMPFAHSAVTACLLFALASLIGGTAAVAALAGLPDLLDPSLHDVGLRVFLAFITVVGVALGPFMAGVVSDGLGMGGHGLSWALSRVCVTAAIVGIVAACLARTSWRRAAMEGVG